MTAKEMFEELGFKEYCSEQGRWLRYRHMIKERSCGSVFIDVVFYLQDNSFLVKNQSQKYANIDAPLLKAINKQVEELGWK